MLIISHPSLKGPVKLESPPKMEDIAPTILELLNVPMPRAMDGKPITMPEEV